MAVLIVMLGLIVYIGVAIVFRGWVLSILWGWFMVPLGVADIGIAWAIGISCVVSMFTANNAKASNKEDDTFTTLATPFVLGLVILLISWVAHVVMVL